MPVTATAKKKTTPNTELAKLEKERLATYADLQEVKRELFAWNDETERLRAEFTQHRHVAPEQYTGSTFKPKPGTEAAEMEAALKQRVRDPNPHQPAYDEALSKFHSADEPCQRFKRHNVRERMAETRPDAQRAVEQIMSAAEALLVGCKDYRAAANVVRDIAIDTPGLGGQHAGYDTSVDELERLAAQILDSDIRLPGLTDLGNYKADSHV